MTPLLRIYDIVGHTDCTAFSDGQKVYARLAQALAAAQPVALSCAYVSLTPTPV